MIRLGLIGYPLGHSLSPRLHEAALKSCGLEGSYTLFTVAPDDEQGLKTLLVRVRNGELTGLNVTIPHKQNVIAMLDELTPTAGSIGAVNTIYSRAGKLIGENTDAYGFLLDLNRFLATHPSDLLSRSQKVPGEAQRRRDLSALVLGAGGSARAVVYALANDGWSCTIAARNIEKAQHLVDSFPGYQLRLTDFNLSNIELSNIDLIVNTTPVGMMPNTEQSPWQENILFPPHAFIYDLVYNPRQTRLVQDARRSGLQATTGLSMLIEQAALSFNIWTSKNPSREVMRISVEQSPRKASSQKSQLTPRGAS